MAFNATEFYNDLIKDAKLTDEQKSALQSALTDNTVVRKLEEGHLRQSDYSRQISEVQAKLQENLTFRQQLVDWQKAEAQRIESERQSLYGTQQHAEDKPVVGITEQAMNDRIRQLEGNALAVMGLMTKKSIEYLREFGKELDTDAVLKKASEEGTNFAIAYDRFVAPERDVKHKAELEERIKKEREEAVKEYQANASIPTSSPNQSFQTPGGSPHVLDLRADSSKKFGWQAAAEAHTRDIMSGTVKHD